jgi:hypothetical protein
VRVRQALNHALDRGELVKLQGGPTVAKPTCQVLPPLIPGYEPTCPYTLHPTEDGAWTAPDLARAKALVAASGTRGMRIVLWSYDFQPYQAVMRSVARTLEDLGYRIDFRSVKDYYPTIFDSRETPQAGVFTWIADFPAAADFLQLLTCEAYRPQSLGNTNVSEFCDPTTDALIEHAERLDKPISEPLRLRGRRPTAASSPSPRSHRCTSITTSTSSRAGSETTSSAHNGVRSSTSSGCTRTAVSGVIRLGARDAAAIGIDAHQASCVGACARSGRAVGRSERVLSGLSGGPVEGKTST